MPFVLVDNWRQILKRSATVWLSAVSQALFVIAGMLYLLADKLGSERTFWLSFWIAMAGVACVSVIPAARIIKQPRLHDADQ